MPARGEKRLKPLAFSHKITKNNLHTQIISLIFKQKKKNIFSREAEGGGKKNPPKAEKKRGQFVAKPQKLIFLRVGSGDFQKNNENYLRTKKMFSIFAQVLFRLCDFSHTIGT